MKRHDDEIPGAQKVAAFLLSLGKDDSASVMRHLDPKVVSDVAEAMTELDPNVCTAESVDSLYEDLARTVYQRTGVRPQDNFELHEILEGTFGADEAQRVIGGIYERRRQEQPFSFVEVLPADSVARVLAEESPAVVALILSHVSPAMSAEVLGVMDAEKGLEIIKRMTTIVPPGIETMLSIADDLQKRLRTTTATPPPRDRTTSLRTVADLLNFSQGDTEKNVLEGLEQEDEEIANEIREYMFAWDDLATVDKRAMQKILASVDTQTLAMSLKASPPAVGANIMANLSSRVREMVVDERDLLGAVPISEVVESRNEILRCVRGLMESGEFSPSRAGEELVT